MYTVFVDDQGMWRPDKSLCSETPPGMSHTGWGKEVLFSFCANIPGDYGPPVPHAESLLPEGRHTVRMVAWLPGTSEQMKSTTSVVLSCQE
ncbi:MAG: hypothetical protein ACREOU_09490 [Candidatus Eiseniibacteriota bacterium]